MQIIYLRAYTYLHRWPSVANNTQESGGAFRYITWYTACHRSSESTLHRETKTLDHFVSSFRLLSQSVRMASCILQHLSPIQQFIGKTYTNAPKLWLRKENIYNRLYNRLWEPQNSQPWKNHFSVSAKARHSKLTWSTSAHLNFSLRVFAKTLSTGTSYLWHQATVIRGSI